MASESDPMKAKPEHGKKDVLDETRDFVIELHGQQNFDVVYKIMNQYVSYFSVKVWFRESIGSQMTTRS